MAESAMTVAVAGATGFVGRHVVRELRRRGHGVRALVRDQAKADHVLPGEGITAIVGGAADRAALATLMEGARGLVNCIGIRREAGPGVTFDKLHVEVVDRLVEAARPAGIRHITQISALGVRPDAPTEYFRSKFRGEEIIRRSGMAWTILRPSVIHGPDSELIQMIKGWVLGRSAPWFFLPYFQRVEPRPFPKPPGLVSAKVAPVHVDDVAQLVAQSLVDPAAAGEVYELGGPETLDWPGLLLAVRDALPMTDLSKKPRGLPAPAGVFMARAAGLLGLSGALPFGPGEPIMASQDNVSHTNKAARQLDWRPVGFTQSLSTYAADI